MNRRNFLKTTGLVSAGLLTSCKVDKQPISNSLNNILIESEKNHAQTFNMCNFSAPKLDVVRVGFVGLGARGAKAVPRLNYIEGVEIKGLCDVLAEKVNEAKSFVNSASFNPTLYSGSEDVWKKLCERDDIDLVYIATPWSLHAEMAIYAMEHGKHVAIEIPLATTVEDCWRVVQTSEKTKKHCMMLENCCYDFFELLTLNLARQGFFGDIVHCEGAYIHEIGEDLFFRGKPGRSWRLGENMKRNGNLYPTHGLGPVAQVMNINRGNKMNYLVSMSSADFTMNTFAKDLSKDDDYFNQFVDKPFRGNMNTTTIKTEKGQTILVQHDVSTQRPYSRLHIISGTKAIAQKYPDPPRIAVGRNDWMPENELIKLEEQYKPALIKKMGKIAQEIGGHGGMDFLMEWRLVDCLRNGLPVDIDVYDGASWSVIGPLSEWSVANRSMPIDIPDFTNGKWKTNQPIDISLTCGGNTIVKI